MFYTARQLEDLWKAGGSTGTLVLPYRARLTPMASDWIRKHKVTLGYSDEGAAALARSSSQACNACVVPPVETPKPAFLWWCDGPCGTAKAALMAQARESALAEVPLPMEPGRLVEAIKHIAREVKQNKAAGGILVVGAGASALVYANRCPSLRAIVGTCMESVEQGISQVAANVLVLEHPYKTLQQMKNLLGLFVRKSRQLPESAARSLAELSSCA